MSLMIVAALGLTACDRTNQEPSLFRTVDAQNATLVTDAKQRVVVNFDKGTHGRRICAEPSPDVTQAFSEALKVAGSFQRSANTSTDGERARDLGISFANSFASSVAQLGERLAVIQLFRDRMYRACEAYANGAIDETAYTLMLARGDKTMATLLTAEMAAGTFGRSLARIGGVAGIAATDPEERAKLQEKITQLTKELEGIAKSDDQNRAQKAAETSKKLTEAHTTLLALDLSAARIAASSGIGGSTLGNIAGQKPGSSIVAAINEISGIHRTFLDDPGLEPLIDACLTALARINLNSVQAKNVAKAQGKIKSAAMKIADLDNNTINFLQGILGESQINSMGIVNNLSRIEKQTLSSLGVDSNDDGHFTKKEIEDTISLSRKSKLEQESQIRAAEIAISSVMLTAGNTFSGFCTTKVFGDLSDMGFIKTMIKSRNELRRIDHSIKLKHLAVCEKMLAGELTPEQRTAVIAFCGRTGN